MLASPLPLALIQAGQSLPPGANAVDQSFAYGAIALLVALIVWQGRSSKGPPPP